MYCAKNFDNITYFRTTNNLLKYERKTGGEVAIFVPDFFNTSYKLVRFSKLNITNKSENSLLVKTAKDKLYFVSLDIQWHDNKRYIAVIDIKSGKPLFMIGKDDETLSDLLHVINRNVIPILQAQKQSISIYLVDLSSDKVGVISWNLMNIRQLIINILKINRVFGEPKNEIMGDEIKYFYIEKDYYYPIVEYDVRYADNASISTDLYAKSITIHLSLSVYGEKYLYSLHRLSINIEVDRDKIVCYWDVTRPIMTVYKKVYEEYENYLSSQYPLSSDNPIMFRRSYSLRDQTGYKYISTDLYENECYYIQQNNNGIMIKNKTPNRDKERYKSSLYRYGKYLIIIQEHIYSKMVFIEPDKNWIYKFIIYIDQDLCSRYRFTYHYYPLYKSNKLLFLSKDLQCLMIVDVNKVDYFINLDEIGNCKALNSTKVKEKYPSVEEVSIALDVKEMITKAIYNKHKLAAAPNSIIILGHQVDKSIDALYIVAKYIIQNVENIGVFILNMSSNVLQLELSSFVIRQPQNLALRPSIGKDNYLRFVSNLDLYNLSLNRVNISNLDVYYNDADAFVSVKYNRISCPFVREYYEKDKLIIENLNNLIIMKYDCSYTNNIQEEGREYAEIACYSSYGLLLCDLVLVQKIPAVLM